MKPIIAFTFALALALSAGSGVRAQDAKPAAKIDTKSIEASVSIDDGLKAYPGLYDNLLAEGRRELNKRRADAIKDSKEMPDVFRGRRYSFERGYTQRSVVGRFVSVVRSDYMDGLGAHPNRWTNTVLWDTGAKKQISIRPFFKETADDGPTMQALAAAIRAALVVEKRARDVPEAEKDSGLDAVKPKILSIGALALAPSIEPNKSSGLIAYFSPYDVGPYVEGDYTVFVPWTAFRQYLSPEGAGLFGGERPAADAEKD